MEWPEHKIPVLNPANKYQIMVYKLFSNVIVSKASSVFLLSKNFVNIFYEAKNDKLLRQDDSPFKSLFTIWFA